MFGFDNDFSLNKSGFDKFIQRSEWTDIFESASLANWASENFGAPGTPTQRHTHVAHDILKALSQDEPAKLVDALTNPFSVGHSFSRNAWLQPSSDDVWLSIEALFSNNKKGSSAHTFATSEYSFTDEDFCLIGTFGAAPNVRNVFAATFRKEHYYAAGSTDEKDRRHGPFGLVFYHPTTSVQALLAQTEIEGEPMLRQSAIMAKIKDLLATLVYYYFAAQDYANHNGTVPEADYDGTTRRVFIKSASDTPVLVPYEATNVLSKLTGSSPIALEQDTGGAGATFATVPPSGAVVPGLVAGTGTTGTGTTGTGTTGTGTTGTGGGLSAGAIAAIIVSVVVVLVVVVGLLIWWFRFRGSRKI